MKFHCNLENHKYNIAEGLRTLLDEKTVRQYYCYFLSIVDKFLLIYLTALLHIYYIINFSLIFPLYLLLNLYRLINFKNFFKMQTLLGNLYYDRWWEMIDGCLIIFLILNWYPERFNRENYLLTNHYCYLQISLVVSIYQTFLIRVV